MDSIESRSSSCHGRLNSATRKRAKIVTTINAIVLLQESITIVDLQSE